MKNRELPENHLVGRVNSSPALREEKVSQTKYESSSEFEQAVISIICAADPFVMETLPVPVIVQAIKDANNILQQARFEAISCLPIHTLICHAQNHIESEVKRFLSPEGV